MEQVTIQTAERSYTVSAARGSTLLAVLQKEGLALSAPCGGNHACGKCLLRAEGALSAISPQEQSLLRGQDAAVRLACFATVQGSCTVTVAAAAAAAVLLGGAGRGAGQHPLFGTDYGVAVDIGTTTLAAYLYGGADARPLAEAGEFNHQQRYGADVMTRIAFEMTDPAHTLGKIVQEQIVALIGTLCARAEIATTAVTAVVLTGNTTMLHLLAGLDVRPLVTPPYGMTNSFGARQSALTLPGLEHARCYLPPCISAYVGADITCGILASGMLRRAGTILLVDIGTNGEMALKTGDRLVCCSTAAGPAFEGAGISCGSGAAAGAICHVTAEDGALAWEAIGGVAATGLCGSGLIDAVAASLTLGYINHTGRLQKELGGSIPFPGCAVSLTQKDIRQVQLAKGAIRTGIETMLYTCGLTYADLDEVLLCGGFGSYLSPVAAEAIGMLPPQSSGKVKVLGNAAGDGAAMLLLEERAAAEAEEICAKASNIELSTSAYFMEQFIKQLDF